MWGCTEFGWMGFGLHGVGMLLFWGFITFAIVVLLRAATVTAPPVTVRREDDALGILKERFARGELSRDEFQTIRGQLGAG